MNRLTLFGIIALVIFSIYMVGQSGNEQDPVACTMEARLCPDGSAVGRVGPKCEFAPCPTAEKTTDAETGEDLGTITGTVLLGPTCPVMTDPPDPACEDRPYQTTLVLTTVDGSRIIKEFSSGADGRFAVTALPGTYAVRSAAAANMLPYCMNKRGKDPIRVVGSTLVDIIIDCDTGIR